MQLNADKTKEMVISFSRNFHSGDLPAGGGKELERIASAKILGVMVSTDLWWAHHLDYIIICSKAKQRLCFTCLLRRAGATLKDIMGFAVRVRSAGQKYGPTCHQRDRADVTEFVTLVRLSSLGQHVGVSALAGYKRRKSALTAGPIMLAFYKSISEVWWN